MLRLAALLVLAGQAAPAPEPREELHTVQKGSLTPLLELDGTFDALETADYKVRMEAYAGELVIARVAAQGQAVRKGEPILEIVQAPLQKQIAAAEIDLKVARSALAKAQAEMKLAARGDALALGQAEAAVANARANLEVFDKVDGKQMLEQADLSVQFSRDGVSDQEEELDQLRKMYKSEELTNATSEIVVRRAARSLERSRRYLRMAEEDAGVVKTVRHPQQRQTFAFALENAEKALEGVKVQQDHARVQRQAELDRSTAAAAQAEEHLARLKRDLEAFTWKAPFDGRVFYGAFTNGQWPAAEALASQLRTGERLLPMQVLLTFCGAATYVRADLPEAAYFDVAPGQAVTLSPVSMPDDRREGKVRAKSLFAALKPGGSSYEAKIDLASPFTELAPGMRARITLRLAERRDVVLVPSNAVSGSGPKHTVTVSKEGKRSPREVTIGKSDGKMTEVKKGLEPGETIVLPKP
jgi:multidrug resistance efflux pump